MTESPIYYFRIAQMRWNASPGSGCTWGELSEGVQKILQDQVHEEYDARFRVSRMPCDSHL